MTTLTPLPIKQTRLAQLKRAVMHVTTALTIISLITVSTVLIRPNKASAWSGVLPSCQSGDALAWQYKDKLLEKNIENKLDNTRTVIMASFASTDLETAGYVLGVYFADTIDFIENPTTHAKSVALTGNQRYYGIHTDSTNPDYQEDVTDLFEPGGTHTISSFACMDVVQGVNYPAGWTGGTYTTTAPQQVKTCDGAFDLKCHISNLMDGVADTLSGMAAAVLNGIGDFFMPDGDYITAEMNETKTLIEEKMGFMLFPIETVVEIFNAYNDPVGACTPFTCTKNFGTWYGAPLIVNFYQIKDTTPTVWTIMTLVSRSMLVITLLYTVRNAYMRTLRW